MPKAFANPTVFVSACLTSAPCRWDGDRISSPFISRLKKRTRLVPVCPEVEIGLGTPRSKIQLVRSGRSAVLYQPDSGKSFTRQITELAKKQAAMLADVDGMIFKSKSPSCGLTGVKLFDSKKADAKFKREGTGIFAAEMKRLLPGLPMVDEAALEEIDTRERFLTAIFTLANFRMATINSPLRGLRLFHEKYEPLLRLHGVGRTEELTRLANQASTRSIDDVVRDYKQGLTDLLGRRMRRKSCIDMLYGALEHFRDDLNRSDIAKFESLLADFVGGGSCLNDLRALVRVWGVRYDRAWVRQPFWQPFPDGLVWL